MVTADEIRKFARLARISLTDAEVEKFRGDMDSIIAYVDIIKKLPLVKDSSSPYLEIENVMRDDANPHETGIHTEELLSQAPKRQGNYLKVKKILS